MKLIFLFITLLSIFLYQASLVSPAFSQEWKVPIKQPKGQGIEGLVEKGTTDEPILGRIFKNVIILFFTIGAIGFTIMILWGAVDWIMSGGDKEKVASARKRITQAIIGLVVLSLTFVIMLTAGQILGIRALYEFQFDLPNLSK